VRHSEARAQWEHTDRVEELFGWSRTADKDMPPSLRAELTKLRSEVARLEVQRDGILISRDAHVENEQRLQAEVAHRAEVGVTLAKDLAVAEAARDRVQKYFEDCNEMRVNAENEATSLRAAVATLTQRLGTLDSLLREEVSASLCVRVDVKMIGRKGGVQKASEIPSCGCWWCRARKALAETAAPTKETT
jgi:chromosome segregation ATPase